jgi:hypothetical protein
MLNDAYICITATKNSRSGKRTQVLFDFILGEQSAKRALAGRVGESRYCGRKSFILEPLSETWAGSVTGYDIELHLSTEAVKSLFLLGVQSGAIPVDTDFLQALVVSEEKS